MYRPDLYDMHIQRSSSNMSNQSNSSAPSSPSGQSAPLKKRLLHAYNNEQRPSSSLWLFLVLFFFFFSFSFFFFVLPFSTTGKHQISLYNNKTKTNEKNYLDINFVFPLSLFLLSVYIHLISYVLNIGTRKKTQEKKNFFITHDAQESL